MMLPGPAVTMVGGGDLLTIVYHKVICFQEDTVRSLQRNFCCVRNCATENSHGNSVSFVFVVAAAPAGFVTANGCT